MNCDWSQPVATKSLIGPPDWQLPPLKMGAQYIQAGHGLSGGL